MIKEILKNYSFRLVTDEYGKSKIESYTDKNVGDIDNITSMIERAKTKENKQEVIVNIYQPNGPMGEIKADIASTTGKIIVNQRPNFYFNEQGYAK
jgi:hypothetical protein